MRIALVYDRVNKFGGAERILLALHEIWPDAPLYTALYNRKNALWANKFKVIPSFVSKLPVISNHHELLPLFTPFAFESFDFSEFDVVISVTSSDAKGILTSPSTLHICYCLTPTRYLWSGFYDYLAQPGLGFLNHIARFFIRLFSTHYRIWDYIASRRPDHIIAISKTVAKRINSYYRAKVSVIYPPVNTDIFRIKKNHKKQNYFLIVSRLVPYKKIDYAISAFNKLGWQLKVIGSGIDESRLKNRVAKNIQFIYSNLTDQKLSWYYQNCKALIFPGEEDYGLTAMEALACGKPVIAYNAGGVTESIEPGITGELYNYPNEKSLISALRNFKKKHYSPISCRQKALIISKNKFRTVMKNKVESLWIEFEKKL